MNEWLQSFVNPSYMPHGHCYLWQPKILWTHVLSDLSIGIAYYAIPIILATFLLKRNKVIAFPEILALFVAFIFLCGTTHFLAIYITWYPVYEIQGWLKAITALVSVVTVVALMPKLPQLITMPGIQEAYEKNLVTLKEIQSDKAEMQSIIDLTMDRETRIVMLKEEVNALLKAKEQAPKYLLDELTE